MSWTHNPLHSFTPPHLIIVQVVVSCGVLDSVVSSLSHESPLVQTAADGVVSAVARSTTDFAHRVMVAGGGRRGEEATGMMVACSTADFAHRVMVAGGGSCAGRVVVQHYRVLILHTE